MLAHVLATNAPADGGGFSFINLLLPLLLAFLIFSMFRRQRKTQQQVTQMRTQMEPGTEVMTQFGLYGTIVSIDSENNKAVLELSPGNTATVHTQALTKVVEQQPADAVQDTPPAADTAVVPDDASSIDGIDTTRSGGSTAAGSPAATTGDTASDTMPDTVTDTGTAHRETPEETLARSDRERAAKDERDTRGPGEAKGNADN